MITWNVKARLMDMRDRRSTYQIGTITREQTSPNTVNWATHIDGSRRNHATLRAAKRHIDRVSAGEVSDGLHECRIHHTPLGGVPMKRLGNAYARVQSIADERCLRGLAVPQGSGWDTVEVIALVFCLAVGVAALGWFGLGPLLCWLVGI